MSDRPSIPCKRCGGCCQTNLFAYVTDEDVGRWRHEGREDIFHILDNESPVWVGDHIISAKTGRELQACPFLSFEGVLALCSIYETRPGTCREFMPGSSELCSQFRGRQKRLTDDPADHRIGWNQDGFMIRHCDHKDFETIFAVINEAAEAYRTVIPDDLWKEPYMSREELRRETRDGVVFWGYEEDGELQGVMGMQEVLDVTLFRHAYVRSAKRNRGIGSRLLIHLLKKTTRPVLIGTWADAVWAIRFYGNHGFRPVSPGEKDRLLKKYWSVPERQMETSVVLADSKWPGDRGEEKGTAF
jgi:Fe-S-cluster containining protein